MPTSSKSSTTPDGDHDDRLQQHYDREFAGITDPGQYAKTGKQGDKGPNASSQTGKKAGKGLPGTGGEGGDADETAASKAARRVTTAAAPEVGAAVTVTQRVRNAVGQHKRTTLFGTIGLVVVIVLLIAVTALLPQELVSLMEDLEQHFFATVDHDLEKESDKLVSRYIQNRILKRLSPECPSSAYLTKCLKERPGGNDEPTSEDPIEGKGGLMDKWDGSELWKQFADKDVIFKLEGDRVFMYHPDLPGGKIDVTKFRDTEGADLFDEPEVVSSHFDTILEAVKEGLVVTAGGYLHNVLTKLLEDKFGVHWCFMDCDPGNEAKDRADVPAAEEAQAADAADAAEATASATEEAQALVPCLADPTCDPDQRTAGTTDVATDPEADPTDGKPTSKFEQLASAALNAVPWFNISSLEQLIQSFNSLKSSGAEWLADAVANIIGGITGADVTGQMVSDVISKFTPLAWAQIAAQFISLVANAGRKIAAFTFTIREGLVIRQFAEMSTSAAEVKSGYNHPEIHELGSETDALHANGSTAESSPNFLNAEDPEHNPQETSGVVRKFDLGNHAALDGNSNVVSQVSNFANSIPGFSWLADLAQIVNKIANLALGPLNALISFLFHITGINQLLADAVGPLLNLLVNYLIPLPNLTQLSGQMKGTLGTVGAHAAGSEAGTGIGGESLTPAQSAAITNEQEAADYQQFKEQPFFARMFSADSPDSLVSQLALDLPNGPGAMLHSTFASILEDPFSKLSDSFSTLLQSSHAFAAAPPPAQEPDGVPDTGVPDNDPVFSQDPDDYWHQHDCAQQAAQDWPAWNAAMTLNPDTGQLEHNTTNGCLTIQKAIEGSGALAGVGQQAQ